MATRHMTRRQQLGERSREEILDVAARLMARHGFDGASIARITGESGLPASSIYWHFGSKEGVLAAVMERGARLFFAAVDAPGHARLVGGDRIRAELDLAAAAIKRYPDFMRLFILLLLTRHADETVHRVRTAGRRRLYRMLREAYLHAGTRRAAALAGRLVHVALAMFDGAFLAVQNEPRLRYSSLLRQAADALEHMAEAELRRRKK